MRQHHARDQPGCGHLQQPVRSRGHARWDTVGKTPVVASMKRGANHILKLQLPGYAPYEATFTKGVSGWVWGNVLSGGLIGLAVDAISGGLYNLTPEQLTAELRNQPQPPATISMEGDTI